MTDPLLILKELRVESGLTERFSEASILGQRVPAVEGKLQNAPQRFYRRIIFE